MLDNKILREYSRQRFFEIWQNVCEGEGLEGEEKAIAAAMAEHKEYYDTWEMADNLADYEYDPETEVNPFFHITMHTIVENQIAMNTPKEVAMTLEKLMTKGESRHEAVHEIGAALSEEIFTMTKRKRPFDESRYAKSLKRLTY